MTVPWVGHFICDRSRAADFAGSAGPGRVGRLRDACLVARLLEVHLAAQDAFEATLSHSLNASNTGFARAFAGTPLL